MAARKKPHPETCERCPHRYSSTGCPCWIGPQAGFVETNVVTGEERFITGCFFQVIPRLMVEVIKASNRPAAAVESTRNEIARGFERVVQGMERVSAALPALLEKPKDGSA